MKQLTAIITVCLLVFASCQKDNWNTQDKVIYSLKEFTDNEASTPGADKNGLRKSNMKIVFKTTTHQQTVIILKVDSVSVDLDGDGVEEMVDMAPTANISAGLNIADPENPDDAIVIFGSNQLNFKRENENGFVVYKSDAFDTKVDLNYQLVELSYKIGNWKFDDAAGQDNSYLIDKKQFMVLPGGKSVEQDPKVALVDVKTKGNGDIKDVVITVEDDPAMIITQMIFVPNPIVGADPKDPKATIQLPKAEFDLTHFNQNTGLARYSMRGRWDGNYGDGKAPNDWNGSGTLYLYCCNGSGTLRTISISFNRDTNR